MLEDYVAEALKQNDQEISLEIILAIISVGLEVIRYCSKTKSLEAILHEAKYPTLTTRHRFKKVIRNYKGDKQMLESTLFLVAKDHDLLDLVKDRL